MEGFINQIIRKIEKIENFTKGLYLEENEKIYVSTFSASSSRIFSIQGKGKLQEVLLTIEGSSQYPRSIQNIRIQCDDKPKVIIPILSSNAGTLEVEYNKIGLAKISKGIPFNKKLEILSDEYKGLLRLGVTVTYSLYE